jgi:hypothetical protein
MNIARVLFLSTASLMPCLAAAQASPAVSEAGPWQFSATVYAYLPTISGNVHFPVTGSSAEFALDANTIIENLNMTFMGAFDAHNGRWGVFTDVVYMDIGDRASSTRDFTIGDIGLPASSTANIHLDMESLIWTLAGEYRVVAGPAFTMDLLGGMRYLDVKQKVDWEITGDLGGIPAAGRSGNAEASGNNWDAVVGVKGAFHMGQDGKWSVPVYLDVGTGDSDFTWQGAVGLTYAFQWGELGAMWRYLDYQFKAGRLEDLTTNGPMIGATFRW